MSRAIKSEEVMGPVVWLDFQDSKTWLQLGVAVLYLAVVYMVTPAGSFAIGGPVPFNMPWLVLTEGMALTLMFTAIRAKFWVVVSPIALAIVLIFARLTYGQQGFLYEGALTMLALISYITAGVVLVTNIFVKENVLSRLGLLAVQAGYCFNLSGWMVRWIEAGEKEGWQTGAINGAWRYFPLDNLYPLTLGFCAGAALTSLVIMRRPKYQFIGALSVPIITVILVLAIFLGNEYRTLPAVLDSYWRPIHVTIATVGYGVCLVSFGLAFAYLLKDGIRSEAVAIAVGLFGIVVYGFIGRVYGSALTMAIPFHREYGASLLYGDGLGNNSHLMVRARLPYLGTLMLIAFLIILASLVLFIIHLVKENEAAKKWGWNLFRGAVVVQGVVLVTLFTQIKSVDSQIKTATSPLTMISEREYAPFGQWTVDQYYTRNNVRMDQRQVFTQERLTEIGKEEIQRLGPGLKATLQSNPVEFGGLVGLFVSLLMVAIFSWKRKDVVDAMPGLEKIDGMLYRTVGVAFPMLSMLLITGAVWANESWGRYWGWDSKEVGALVAWMAYAGFLHTRIAHGWRGRRSAYFALLGFALVIFTWLGVSYLLPGLHSYA
jgi:ABC-type transport system involved in cytochrome c biogenesis permease subunit